MNSLFPSTNLELCRFCEVLTKTLSPSSEMLQFGKLAFNHLITAGILPLPTLDEPLRFILYLAVT
ncbi:Uncharacterised protein [Chlamydia trachomatis]|nr:Uncharacterised protein [Chlamydia trachomatis]